MTQALAEAPAEAVAPTPERAPSAFLLAYGSLPIGTLRRRATEWVFEYTPEFRA